MKEVDEAIARDIIPQEEFLSEQSDGWRARADTDENPLLRHFDDRREEESPRLQREFSVASLP